MNSEKDGLLSARGIYMAFNQGVNQLQVLRGIDLDIYKGEALCIVGASGAGKSTLLHILGTLERPTEGELYYKGDDLLTQSDEELAKFRNKTLGFVFQFHHLLSEFTALENIMMPVRIGGGSARRARDKAEELISIMGLTDRKHHYPSELSGGEKQRIAIARALVQEPEILLADEPTGNLDTENDRMVQDLFFELKDKFGLTLLVVTHDTHFAARFPRVLTMQDGRWLG